MFSEPRFLALAVLAVSVAALGAAFGFQHLGDLDPCVLCVYQRWPWVAACLLALLALARAVPRPDLAGALLGLAVLVLLAGAGLAAYHVGVEQHWWAGTAECGGVTGQAQTVEELRRQLMATPVVRCDEVAWSVAGISMAGWNLILSLAVAVVLAWRLIATQGRPR